MATKTKKAKAKPTVNIFANATVIEPKKAKPKSKAKAKREVDMGTSLDVSAAIGALTVSLESIKETIDEELKAKMTKEFVEEAIRTQRRPESFKGTSTQSSASCEIRKRSTRSVLKEEEINFLNLHGVETETKVIKEAIPERYVINPKAFAEPELLQEISNRLDGLTTKDGEGLVLLQEAKDAVEAEVVGNNTLDDVSKKITNPSILARVFEIVSVNALGKFKLEDSSLNNIFAILLEAGIDARITD